MAENSSIFDMLGPIMIGPSSSHTAGVVRIGRVAVRILGGQPKNAVITFYNSFARTYQGHGSDRAILAGLLDFATDDIRIRDAFDHTQQSGLNYSFKTVNNASTRHPNTIKLDLSLEGKKVLVVGESRGGGMINIAEVNGFTANFSANLHSVIVTADDTKGSIAFVTDVISHDDCNIATMSVSRKAKNDLACQVIEMDSGLKSITIAYLRSLSWIHEVIYIPNIDL